MTTLLLVRHGATEWNELGRLQGGTDIPLSTAGESQVRALRPLVDRWHPERAVASPLERTLATAGLLYSGVVVEDARLREIGLGEWEGMHVTDLGAAERAWRRGRLVPPGGEPLAHATERILAAVEEIAGGPAATSLVVTHGGVIRAVLAELVGLRLRNMVPVAPASLTVLQHDGDHWRLRVFGVTEHSSSRPRAG